uniref:Uncharacterized protein n=1 Tax=Arundo donax TaxID=35708 RepID=A0A0A9BT28_ARUDO
MLLKLLRPNDAAIMGVEASVHRRQVREDAVQLR